MYLLNVFNEKVGCFFFNFWENIYSIYRFIIKYWLVVKGIVNILFYVI